MNKRMVAFFVGKVLRIESVLMLLPLLVSILLRESAWIYIAVAVLLTFLCGTLLHFPFESANQFAGRRDGSRTIRTEQQ